MELDLIFGIIDSNVKVAKKNLRNAVFLGLFFMLLGAFVGGTSRMGERPFIYILFGAFGLLFCLPWMLDRYMNWTGKRAEKYKYMLQFEPKELVWAYVFRYNNRGHVTISVILKFRNGKAYSVSDKAIPGRDTSALLLSLHRINPEMKLGYTKELERQYNRKQM
jgi:hypothetical protein